MTQGQCVTVILLASVLFLYGCVSISSSGVFASGKDTYTVTSTGEGAIRGRVPSMGALMRQAYEEANAFCQARGKVMQPVGTVKHPYGAYFELTFRALDPDDPEYQRPILETVPDAKIELQSH